LATDASKEKILRHYEDDDHRFTIEPTKRLNHNKNESILSKRYKENNARSENETLI